MPHDRTLARCWAAALVALYAALVVPSALYHPLASFDEAWYAAVARNILEQGDWWTLRYNGAIFWDKPPIAIWSTAVFFQLFGVSDFGARAFSLLCGAATLLLVQDFGRRRHGRPFGLLVGLLLLGAHDWLRFCAKGQMDVPVVLFVTAHVLFFWRGLEQPRWHWASGVCLGLAIATKNQVGLFGALAIAAYILLSRTSKPLRQREFWGSQVLALAVAAPWFAQQYWAHGAEFVRQYLYMNFFHRQYGQLAGAGADYWFYPRYLASRHPMLLAAAGVSAAWLIVQWAKQWRQSNARGENIDLRWPMLLALWVAVVVAACIKIGATHFWYLLPMYPALALLAGEAVRHSRLWMRPKLVGSVLAVWAIGQHVGYYIPPPQEFDLRAARAMAVAVRAATPADEAVYLLQAPVGDPRREIFIPAAHFYFDRIAVEVGDRALPIAHVLQFQEVTLVGDERRLNALINGSGAGAPAFDVAGPWHDRTSKRIAASRGFAAYRLSSVSDALSLGK